ncbi:hypothetical protein CFAM422_010802 [Trichoderma lentiforme]|uniref:Uncharacterized protein n=1 Tax=Trichoderma lentiforme TaxID=1567552 RepID=A0A9P4X8H0_9HYPO|nr:hypothetical protein CFAM422_010802 [Trichoderma lentiforme]
MAGTSYIPPVEKLQSTNDWEAWKQTIKINARILGLWKFINGKVPQPIDPNNLKATEFLINSLLIKIRVKLDQKGFNSDTITSKNLFTLIQTTVLKAPEEDMFNVILDFNKIDRRAFTTLNAYVSALTKG